MTYVPLEVINKRDKKDIENNEMEQINNISWVYDEMFYTDFDKFRSEALKNTLVNISKWILNVKRFKFFYSILYWNDLK